MVRSSVLLGASAKSRMAYLSNKERNRRKHAENGNPPKKTQEQIQRELDECLAWIRDNRKAPEQRSGDPVEKRIAKWMNNARERNF